MIANLIAELARARAPPEVPVDDGAAAAVRAVTVAARAERINKMNIALRKSQKVKEYIEMNDISIKEWLTRFDQEITALKRIYGVTDDLTRDEIVEFFKDRLDYKVIKRLDTAFAAKEPVWNWGGVTYDQLKDVMKAEYGSKLHPISEVLQQFGAKAFMKQSDVSVSQFTHEWQEQIPECMQPADTIEELRKFADRIKRSLYYYCLNDSYLHKELNKLEEDDATFKKCFDAAVAAEQKRKSLQEIGKGAAGLDHSGVNISRVDVSAKASNSNNQSGDSSSYNQSSSSQPYNQSGGNVQAGSSQQLYSSGRGSRRPGYNQQSQSQSGDGSNRSGAWWYRKSGQCFQCGRFGHYAKECRDGTSVKAVEVKNDDCVSFNKLQVMDKDEQVLQMYKLEVLPDRKDEQIVTLNELQVEPSGTDRAQSSGKSVESVGLNGGGRRSFSRWCKQRVPVSGAGNSRRGSGRGGRCWKCGKFGHHRAQCWTHSPQKQPGYVGRGPHRKQSTTGLTDSIDYGVLAKYVVAAMHDVDAKQGSMLQSPQQCDGFIGGKRPQLQMNFKSSRWRRSLQV